MIAAKIAALLDLVKFTQCFSCMQSWKVQT